MRKAQACEHLLHDALFDPGAPALMEPSEAALRALRQRRRTRRVVRATALATITVVAAFPVWQLLQRTAGQQPNASPAVSETSTDADPHTHTRALASEEIVHTTASIALVHSSPTLPEGVVVHTRPNLFTPLSDRALLALLADRDPILVGPPGDRHLILRADAPPQ